MRCRWRISNVNCFVAVSKPEKRADQDSLRVQLYKVTGNWREKQRKVKSAVPSTNPRIIR